MGLQLEQDLQKTEILVYPTTHYLTPESIKIIGPNDALLHEAHLRGVCDKLTVNQPSNKPDLPDLARGYREIDELINTDKQATSQKLLRALIARNNGNPIKYVLIDGDLPDEKAKELVGDKPPFNIDPTLGAVGIYLSAIGVSGYAIAELVRRYNYCVNGNQSNTSMTRRHFLLGTGLFLGSLTITSIPFFKTPVLRNSVHNGVSASVDSTLAAFSSEYPYFLRISEMSKNLRNVIMAMNINAYANHSPNSVHRAIAQIGEAHKDVVDDVRDIEGTADKLTDYCDLLIGLANKVDSDERLDSAQRYFVMWNYLKGLSNYYVFNENPEDNMSRQIESEYLSAQAYFHKYLLKLINQGQVGIQASELLINAMITQMLMDDLYLSRIKAYTGTNIRQGDPNSTRHPISYNTFQPNENTEIIYFPKTRLIPRKFSDGNEIVGIAIYRGNSYPLTRDQKKREYVVINQISV